jgi:hypothetical protein
VSVSCQMSTTSCGHFGSLLDLLGHTEWHVGVSGGQVGHDSVGCSGGVIGPVMLEGGGHHFGCVLLLDGSFTVGGGLGCQVGGTSSCYFGSVLDGLRDSPTDHRKRRKGRHDSVGSGGGRVGAVMFNFGGPNFVSKTAPAGCPQTTGTGCTATTKLDPPAEVWGCGLPSERHGRRQLRPFPGRALVVR